MTGPVAMTDWDAMMGDVAIALLGEPNAALSNERELRYGRRGSLAVHVAGPYAGRFYDHEAGESGGVLDLVQRECGGNRCEAWAWLCAHGFLSGRSVPAQERGPRVVTTRGADARETQDKRTRARTSSGRKPARCEARSPRPICTDAVWRLPAHGRCDSTHAFDIRSNRAGCPVWWRVCRTVEGGFSAFNAPTCRARTRRRCGRFA